MSDLTGHILGVGGPTAVQPVAGRRRTVARPVADLSPAAIALSKQQGTYDSPGHVCDVCREWTDAIWYVGPQYPRTRFCARCATAIGQGPQPREAGRADR